LIPIVVSLFWFNYIPDIKIGNAFSLHGVLNKNLEHIVEDLAIGDFVAFTYFPVDSLNEINKNPTAAISDLEKTFDLVPNKNVAFFEISWSTADLVGGSQTAQKEFLNLLFDFYKENESKLEFVTWYRLYDRPQDSCYIDPNCSFFVLVQLYSRYQNWKCLLIARRTK